MSFVWVIVTALLSSAFTLGAVVYYYQKIAQPRLRAQLDEVAIQLGADIEERVRRGVLAALADAASGEPLREATRKVTRTGASLVSDSLSALLGTPRRPDKG